MIYDCFMYRDEADILEARLYELQDIRGLTHVAVEADVDHQGHAKPYYLTDNLERFSPWAERLIVVRAKDLPTVEDDPDPWAREGAQREWVRDALTDAASDDIILHGDVDEIPNVLGVRNVRPRPHETLVFVQRLVCFAVDWEHPQPWNGTVAARLGAIQSFAALRGQRNFAPSMPGALAGWHLSWLGGRQANFDKLGAFCHPEVERTIADGLATDDYLRHGYHVDGEKLLPVDVDATWPRWVHERKCPDNWFRPR